MDKYGLIGFPLGHSFSSNFFNEKFSNENIAAEYVNFEIPQINYLQEVLLLNPQLKGLNVTLPYKEQIIPLLDDLSPEAKAIGAVNVVKIIHRGKKIILKGYNSDVIGFTKSIEPLLEPFHKKALILGTGGAAKAVNLGLKSLGIDTQFVGRNKKYGAFLYKDLTEEIIKSHPIIVNCTPIGMFPHEDEAPLLPYQAINKHHLVYDLIYNPDETLFMKKAKAQGATVKNGLEMLLLQAFASWDFWQDEE